MWSSSGLYICLLTFAQIVEHYNNYNCAYAGDTQLHITVSTNDYSFLNLMNKCIEQISE